MLSLMLSLALMTPAPQAQEGWVLAAASPHGKGTASVQGSVELTRAEAEASALRLAGATHRERLRTAGDEVVQRVLPDWLPRFFVRHELDEWTRRLQRELPLDVVQNETKVRRYSYGEAFQTTLHWDADVGEVAAEHERWFEQRVTEAGKLLLAKFGGIAVYWGLLAFLSSWFDRLTRGYMTWRLRTISLGLGISLPAVLLLV